MAADHDAQALATSVAETAAHVLQHLGPRRPRLAVVLGSGWGPFVEQLQDAISIPYAELPAFPRVGKQAGVDGHAGLLWAGRLGAQEVLVLAGRKHAYENGQADAMKGAIRSLATLGVQTLVQTNAAGSLDPAAPPGSVMLITDHLNLVQRSPLVGEIGSQRFVDMSDAYCPHLAQQARDAAQAAGLPLAEGVYAWLLGPQFETPAEIRMLKLLGAQAVGMSTVPETILARHAGLRVLALSLITNMAAGLSAESLSHGHTLATAQASSQRAVATLKAVVQGLGDRP